EEAEPVAEEPEPEPESEPEPEPEPELEPAAVAEPEPESDEHPRRRWWHRRDEEPDAPEGLQAHEPPRHVRVLSPEDERDETAADPWERGFDAADVSGEQTDEDTGEGEPAVTAEAEEAGRRKFRRR